MLSEQDKTRIKNWGLWRALYAGFMVRYRHRFMMSWIVLRGVQDAPRPSMLGPNREVRAATLDELITAASDSRSNLDAQWVREAHARGEVCYAVFEGDRILSYSWRTLHPTPHEKGLEIRFNPGYVYGYYAFTHPLHRRQGLQNAVDYYSDHHLKEQGYQYGLGFIETYNYASLIAQRKRGARKVGYAGYLTLFGRVFTFRSPGAKKYGFGFFHVQPDAIHVSSNHAGTQALIQRP